MAAYIFPGQGSQYVGMGRPLFEQSAAARTTFEKADTILDLPLSQLCFKGPAEELDDTAITQPAILTMSIAALRALEGQGTPPPEVVAGHSMGEFSALVAAGALGFEDGLQLVRERGRLMKEAGETHPGGMVAVLGADRELLVSLCKDVRDETGEYVGIANDNCPGQIVISGTDRALKLAMERMDKIGARRSVRLAVSIAAHSPLMSQAALEFQDVLEETPLTEAKIPVVANATAQPLTDPEELRQAVSRQLTSPVHWTDSMRWILDHGTTAFIEVGPKNVLVGLLRRIDRSAEGMSFEEILQTDSRSVQ